MLYKIYEAVIPQTAKLALVLCLANVPTLTAAPVVDGKYDAGEGYTMQSDIILKDKEGDPATSLGKFYSHVEGESVYGLVIVPLDYVDNSYGTKDDNNSVGWGSKVHTFNDLERSDEAEFDLKDSSGTKVMTFETNYIERNKDATNPANEYRSESEVKDGEDAWLLQAATSLEYNSMLFNTFLEGDGIDPIGMDMVSPQTTGPGSYDIVDVLYSDWIFEVQYEFQIDLAAFGAEGFGSLDIAALHASPKKTDYQSIMVTPPTSVPQTAVPEPQTYAALGSFILMACFARRRRTASAAA